MRRRTAMLDVSLPSQKKKKKSSGLRDHLAQKRRPITFSFDSHKSRTRVMEKYAIEYGIIISGHPVIHLMNEAGRSRKESLRPEYSILANVKLPGSVQR